MPAFKPFFPILMIASILIVVGASVAHASDYAYGNGVVPLTFHDSGYELPPGYKISVSLHAEAERNVVEYGFAPAAIKIGPLEIGYDATPPGWGGLGSLKVYFYVKNGNQELLRKEIDSLHYAEGKKAYETTVTITQDCHGNVVVHTDYGTYTVQVEPGPIDLYEQSSSVDGIMMHLKGWVQYGEVEQIADCGDHGGDLPRPSDRISDEPGPLDWLAKKWLIGLGAIIIILLLIRGILPW